MDWLKIGKEYIKTIYCYPAYLTYMQSQSVQLLSRVQLFVTSWTAACQASLAITNSQFTQTHIHWVGDAIQPSHPLSSLPSIFPNIRVFSNVLAFRISWTKYWSFSFNISLSNEYLGLISLRMDLLDLLAAQGTLKSLLQHHSSKASILQCSAFIIVQLWHPYMTTGKTIALTRWTFVGKIMFLLFNMLCRLVITFLPRSKHHFGERKIKNIVVSRIDATMLFLGICWGVENR